MTAAHRAGARSGRERGWLRSALSGGVLVRRRLRRDAALVLLYAGLVAASVVIGGVGPALLVSTMDRGAREAVEAAGSDADVVVSFPMGASSTREPTVDVADIEAVAAEMTERLPAALRSAVRSPDVLATTSALEATPRSGVAEPLNRLDASFALLTESVGQRIRLAEGRIPATGSSGPIGILISSDVADAARLDEGDQLSIESPDGSTQTVEVTGILADASSLGAWGGEPGALTPITRLRSGRKVGVGIAALTDAAGLTRITDALGEPQQASIRFSLDPATLDAASLVQVGSDVDRLEKYPSEVATIAAPLQVRSGLSVALETLPAASAGASAQITLFVVGALACAGIALVVVARTMWRRRGSELALERARGASLLSMSVRACAESAVAALIGLGIGVTVAPAAVAAVASGGASARWGGTASALVVTAAVLALVAPAFWTIRVVSRRSDSASGSSEATVWSPLRFVIEAFLVIGVIAAFVSLTSRGPIAAGGGADPLVVALPLLIGALAAAVVLRLHGPVLRVIAAVGRARDGATGLVAGAVASSSGLGLAFAAVTVAVTLAVAGGVLGSIVATGQTAASWQRVGAEARIDDPAPDIDAVAFASVPGVTAAGAATVIRGAEVTGAGSASTLATIVAVDDGYCAVIDARPDLPAATGTALCEALDLSSDADADASAGAGGPIRAVPDRVLADRIARTDAALTLDDTDIPLTVAEPTGYRIDGYESGPFLFVSRADLARSSERELTPDTILLAGPGAADAASASGSGDERETVLTRVGRLDAIRSSAFASGVSTAYGSASVALAVLAGLAFVAAALAGATRRGRALALLRTLGVSSRAGLALIVADVVPLLLGALVVGTGAGIAAAALLAPRLALTPLTGGLTAPAFTVAPAVVLAVAAALLALLILTIAAEQLAHRRARLSNALRVGEP